MSWNPIHSGSNSENSHQRKKIPIFFFQREKLHLFPFLFFPSFRKIPISFSFQVFSPFWVSHQNFLPGFFTILAFPSKLPSRFFLHFHLSIKTSFQVFSPFGFSHQRFLPSFFTIFNFPSKFPSKNFSHLLEDCHGVLSLRNLQKKIEFVLVPNSVRTL